jgi:hypothetical protein
VAWPETIGVSGAISYHGAVSLVILDKSVPFTATEYIKTLKKHLKKVRAALDEDEEFVWIHVSQCSAVCTVFRSAPVECGS